MFVEGLEELSSILTVADKTWLRDLSRRQVAFGQREDRRLMSTFADNDAKLMRPFYGDVDTFARRTFDMGFAPPADSRLVQAFADYIPEADTGTAWPMVNGKPMKVTDERVLKFLQRHLKQVIASKRYTIGYITMMRDRHGRDAARHSNMAKKLGDAVEKQRVEIAGLKVAYDNAKGSKGQQFAFGRRLLAAEAKLRALVAEFALHGAAAQAHAMAAGVLGEALKEPNNLVRARAVAFSEVMVKMPQQLGIVEKQNGGVPTASQLAARPKLREKAIRGRMEVLPPASFVQRGGGLGDTTRYPDSIWNGYAGFGQAADPVDPWGRVRPGATPREESTLLFIDRNLGSFGDFDGGWWTRYKRRMKDRWARWKKNWKKDAKKNVEQVVKDAATEVQKEAAKKLAGGANLLMEKTGNLLEKGIDMGLKKLGDTPGSTTSSEMLAPTDMAPTTGGRIPGWVLPVAGISLVGLVGGYVWWKRRR